MIIFALIVALLVYLLWSAGLMIAIVLGGLWCVAFVAIRLIRWGKKIWREYRGRKIN